ncbi:MAG: hypothetical protein AVDCRST_MAG88-2825, partial [uncultured Thermomicrobiales bacterium]
GAEARDNAAGDPRRAAPVDGADRGPTGRESRPDGDGGAQAP